MAKRKSFEEKSKGMHKSRKLIIDTVFGRTDDNQKVFGYDGEAKVDRKVGERWVDKEGKEWEQHEGFVMRVTQMDDVRSFLDKLNTCKSDDCETTEYSWADKKLIRKTGHCVHCMRKIEQTLITDGTYPYYVDYKETRNKLAFVIDDKMRMEDALSGLAKVFQTVGEDGRMENWTWNVDIEKVAEDLRTDIKGAIEAIEALFERKKALEDKLEELNHPELIKK
jgi:hypothetical protein